MHNGFSQLGFGFLFFCFNVLLTFIIKLKDKLIQLIRGAPGLGMGSTWQAPGLGSSVSGLLPAGKAGRDGIGRACWEQMNMQNFRRSSE